MGGHGHDGAGTVAGEYIVRNEHGNARTVDRVGGVHAQEYAGFFFVFLAFQVGFCRNGGTVCCHRLRRCGMPESPPRVNRICCISVGRGGVYQGVNKRVLGGKHHVGGTKQRVGAGGEHSDRRLTRNSLTCSSLHCKIHLSTA